MRFHVSYRMFHANMPFNQQIRTMQGDIEELQKKGMAAPPRPQRSEPPQGLPVEEKLAPPAPPSPALRVETQPPAPPRPAPPRMEIRPPMPPKPVQPAPLPTKPPQEELSAKERLFITPKPTVPAPTPPAPPKKIEPERPSFKPTVPLEKARWSKVIFTTILIAALAGGIGGFFYWWFVVKQPPLPPPPPPLEKPISLIPIDETKDYIITLTETNETPTADIGAAAAKCNEPLKTFRRILIKNTISKEEYLNLFQLLDIMRIPGGFLMGISDPTSNYTLFSYAENNAPLPDGCGRIGLAIEINDIEEAKKQVAGWVPYIENELENNMKDILTIIPDLTPATPDFQDNLYKNTRIRYKNYPDPDFSFDYAVYEPKNLLIFTTSRESMWAVIDKLEQ